MLSLDPDCCCAMITCAENSSVFHKDVFAMIWSRERNLDKSILDELKNKIVNYIDKDNIIDVDNSCIGISF